MILSLTPVASCGKGADQPVGEKIGEEVVSGLTGGAIAVDVDKKTVTFTDEDGKSVDASLSEGAVPTSFPLPVPQGRQPEDSIETDSDGALGWVGLFYFQGDVRAEAASYQQQLESMGLEVRSMVVEEGDDYSNLLGVSGVIDGKQYSAMIAFSNENGQNAVSVVFGEGTE